MANYLVTDTELASVRSAIQTKAGASGELVFPSGFNSAIEALQVGDDCNATAGDIRNGKTAVVNRAKITGNMTEKSAETFRPTRGNQSVSANTYVTGEQKFSAVVVDSQVESDYSSNPRARIKIGCSEDDDSVGIITVNATLSGDVIHLSVGGLS